MTRLNILFAALLAAMLLSQAAFASDPLKGRGHLQARDAAAGVVVIDERSYHVTANTRLEWSTGEPFELSALTLPEKPGTGGLWPYLTVLYDAVEGRDGLVLNEMTILRDGE